jgi:predicted Fe-Mo cluster-binding NifX family protein
MVAIPVLRFRVAPVLDWCSRMRIFPVDPFYEGEGQELSLPALEAGQRLQVLREKGVTAIICGALSEGLLHYAKQLEIKVICGVAGEIKEVLHSFWNNKLDNPNFCLPGCQGLRRYRNKIHGRIGACQGNGPGKSLKHKLSRGLQIYSERVDVGDMCLCPVCGTTFPHARGIPCQHQRCTFCGCHLVRH